MSLFEIRDVQAIHWMSRKRAIRRQQEQSSTTGAIPTLSKVFPLGSDVALGVSIESIGELLYVVVSAVATEK